jgi:hypothetical protein
MTTPEITIIITTVTTGVIAIINTIFNGLRGRRMDDKLDAIHEQTNGGWAKAHQELSVALGEIVELKKLIKKEP